LHSIALDLHKRLWIALRTLCHSSSASVLSRRQLRSTTCALACGMQHTQNNMVSTRFTIHVMVDGVLLGVGSIK
jgi:hypothetical protein